MRYWVVLSTMLAMLAIGGRGVRAQGVEWMLEGFAEDYRHDPMALDAYFGIKVGDDAWWTVRVDRAGAGARAEADSVPWVAGPHEVKLRRGEPREPTWYFEVVDAETLKRLHDREVSPGTLFTRSFASDRTPLSASAMEGYDADSGTLARVYHVLTHFWTTGTPEVTLFDRERGLPVHGTSMVSLYNMKDKRVTWFSIGAEETVNENSRLERDRSPNLFVFTRGRGRAQIADREMDVHAGMSVFVPAYTKHVIWNPYDEPLEGVLVLYGDNYSFSRGTSYVDFTEDLYDFYGDYDYGD